MPVDSKNLVRSIRVTCGSTIGFHLLAHSRNSHEYSSLFIIVINLIFMFLPDALTELGAYMGTKFFYVFLYYE